MKNKKRVVLVIAFLILFAVYVAVNVRGEYLQTLEIGEQYVEVFKQNLKRSRYEQHYYSVAKTGRCKVH